MVAGEMKTNVMEFTAAYPCCGIGGGAIGFAQALVEFGGVIGKFKSLYGIDVDPNACADFERLTGLPAYCLDLFDREQYMDWHGHEPPQEWREVTPEDIRELSGGVVPDVIFSSPPCKGFSGLLPKEQANSKKYQALNRLYYRIIWLYVMAFQDDLPKLFLIENVPRVKTRGVELIEKVKKLLKRYGYTFQNSDHDCGEIGALGQERNRNLFIARHEAKMPTPVHEAPKKRHKTIGDIIGPLPFPGDPASGPMHQLPKLEFATWMRLACIRAGGDWRDLKDFDHTRYTVVNIGYTPRNGALAVEDWNKSSRTVSGGAGFGISNGAAALADLRFSCGGNRHVSHFRVEPWNGVSGTVTGATHIANGRICIADPKLKERKSRHPGVYEVIPLDQVGHTVTGTRFGSGVYAIADNRHLKGGYSNKHKVLGWNGVGNTVTGMRDVQEGAPSIADPRPGSCHTRPGDYGVLDWYRKSPTVRGAGRTMNSAVSISDPRVNCKPRSGTYGVMSMHQTASTVIASNDIHAGASAISDDRRGLSEDRGHWTDCLGPEMTKGNIKKMVKSLYRDCYPGCAPVASLRKAIKQVYVWEAAGYYRIPHQKERGVWIILSPHDQAWHRPLTTLELAALQGLRPFMRVGKVLTKRPVLWAHLDEFKGYKPKVLHRHNPFRTALQLVGNNDASWRERIGNMVPPPAAKAVAEAKLVSLIASAQGYDFILSAEPIWVVPDTNTNEPVLVS